MSAELVETCAVMHQGVVGHGPCAGCGMTVFRLGLVLPGRSIMHGAWVHTLAPLDDLAYRCSRPVSGTTEHVPEHASGRCMTCGTVLAAIGALMEDYPEVVWWFELPEEEWW